MKKIESSFKALPGCRITSTLATFPQIVFVLSSLSLPGKFTMKGGERTTTALKNLIYRTFSRQDSTKFDITQLVTGRKK